MGIRDYLQGPVGRNSISQAIRGAFEKKRVQAGVTGRILVLDKDPLIREALVRTLQRESYRVAGAADCDEALRLSDRQSFDLLITDSPTLERDRSETLVKPFDDQQLLRAIKRVMQS